MAGRLTDVELVRVLVGMKFAMLRHSPPGQRPIGWALGALLVLATWTGALLAAPEVRTDVLVLLLVLWGVGAALGPVTMSGSGVLRADQFTLLPLDRGRLAVGLVVATFPGIASGYVLLALLSIAALAGGSVPATAVALVGALLGWVVVITTSRLVFAALGSLMRTKLGVEISAMQFGVFIAAMLAGWMVVAQAFRTVPDLLREGLPDGTALTVLAWVPTSWPVRAVEAAGAGEPAAAAGWLAALAVLAALLVGLAALLLRADLDGTRARRRRRPLGSRVLTGRAVLPDTPLGAVVGKEVRQWWRDPWRGLEIRTAVWTGLASGLFAVLSVQYAAVAPLAGLVIAFMVCLAAVNLYGQDGSALWITVVGETERTVRDDVLGRQIATVLLFAPPALVVSVTLVVLSGAHWAWPVVLAALPALFGVAAGVAVTMSAVAVSPGVDPRRRVGPNDAGGDLGLQAQIAFWVTPLLALPTVLALVALHATGPSGWVWLAVPVGVLNGWLVAWLLGRATTRYLQTRLPSLFTRIRYRRNESGAPAGVFGWLESSSHQSEEKARAQKEKRRQDRAGQRGRAAARSREPV